MGVVAAVIGVLTSILGFLTAAVKLKKELQDRRAAEERVLSDPDSTRPLWSPGQTVLASTLFGFGTGMFFGSLCYFVDPRNTEGIIGMMLIFSIVGISVGLFVGFKLAGSYKERRAEWLAEVGERRGRRDVDDRLRRRVDDENDEQKRFAEVSNAVQVPSQSGYTCGNCGTPLASRRVITCPGCGTSIAW